MERMVSSKGNPLIIHEGYKFRLFRKTDTGLIWRCTSKSCCAMLSTDKSESVILEAKSNHSHDKPKSLHREVIRNSVKRKAVEDILKIPVQLIRQEIASASEQYSSAMTGKDVKLIKRAIGAARRSNLPFPPKLNVDIHEDIHDLLSSFANREKDSLLREAELQSELCNVATSSGSHSTVCPDVSSTGSEISASGRKDDIDFVNKEELKQEELIFEECELGSDGFEHARFEKSESNQEAADFISDACSSIGAQFETVICGIEPVKIKEEIDEHEMVDFGASQETDAIPPDSETTDVFVSQVDRELIESSHSGISTNLSPTGSLTNKAPATGKNPHIESLKRVIINRTEHFHTNAPKTGTEMCKICNESFTSSAELLEHSLVKHSGDESRGVCSQRSVSASSEPSHSVAIKPVHSNATIPGLSVASTPVHSPATAPGQPPHDSLPPHSSDCDVFDGVFISLKSIPMERRKKTKDKILRLVKLISDLDIDPDEVSFTVTTK